MNSIIALRNSVVSGLKSKTYLPSVKLAVVEFSQVGRRVFMNFRDGPQLELSLTDMDVIAAQYLTMRKPVTAIELVIEGGVIQQIRNPSGVRITIRDYDCDGYDGPKPLWRDSKGDAFHETILEGDL
jgi:hypothetical protein